MADDNTTKVVLDLDNSDFNSKMKEALGLVEGLGNVEALSGLASSLVGIGMILGPVVVAIMAVKAALDLTKEGEHIEMVNNSFHMLATNAGLAADEIKEKLLKSVAGLASETEVLQAANKAILTMGDNAAKIPQVMDLARKYTANFGGDLVENFERMSMAMSNGNQRMLKQFGITVDATKAHQEFAKSIGTSTEFLDQAGQKQAIFNAALAQANSKYKNLSTTGLDVTTGTQKLMTSFVELKEAVATAFVKFEQTFHVLKDLTNGMAFAVEAVTYAFKHYAGIHEESSKTAVDGTKKEMDAQKALAGEVDKTNDKYKDKEKILKAETKFAEDLVKIKQASEKAQEQTETNLANFKKLREQEILTAALEASAKMHDLQVNAHAKGLITDQQYAEAQKNIQKKLESDVQQIRNKANDDEIKALQNLEKQNEKTAAGFAAGWHKNGAQATKDVQNMAKLGETSSKTLATSMTGAFKAIGDGSQNAAQAMQSAMFGAIGSIAEQQGEFLILSGIGTYDPIAVAEGIALVALGSAISGMGGSSSSSSGGGGGSSSASVGAPASAVASSSSPTPQAAQQKSLTVAINGNIFETDQTRTRLMDMIRQSQDMTDFSLKNIGTA